MPTLPFPFRPVRFPARLGALASRAANLSLPRSLAALFIVGATLGVSPLRAFPPAPHYTVYGDVRDEFGYLIPASGATVIFSFNNKEVSRHEITSISGADYNYQIRMRIDMARLGTASYSSLAVSTGATYTLAVDIGGVVYYPLEINTPPKVGASAERRRLDLTLGSDTDGDGLPDAWEQLQLYLAGLSTADLTAVTPGGDLDGDGLTNLQEYIAGTYAADASETFYLKIKELTETDTVFEFFAITSKVYVLETSTDMQTWTPTNFRGGTSTTSGASYTATAVGMTNGYVARTPDAARTFYRLKVR